MNTNKDIIINTNTLELEKTVLINFEHDQTILEKVKVAIEIAKKAHGQNLRKSGEPLINHSLRATLSIIEINLDINSIFASILHDVYDEFETEETVLNSEIYKKIDKFFGSQVNELLLKLKKVNRISKNSTRRYIEILNLRKLLIASSKDVRILLIRLALRLDNMRTVQALNEKKRKEYSQETLEVYSPLAEYIGIGSWKRELDDISFKITQPEIYQFISNKVYEDQFKYEIILEDLIRELKLILGKNKTKYQKIFGRIKSVFSIYNKFLKFQSEGRKNTFDLENFDFKVIKDFAALSIVLKGEDIECYQCLGLVHSKYKHFSSEFKDYIAKPKRNGYKSIHTVIKFKNVVIEIQIKTEEMHHTNEYGSASHVGYKLSKSRQNPDTKTNFKWVKQLNTWQNSLNINSNKFQINAFNKKVYVITPKGKIIELKKGSTPIDFAYMIHTSVGNRCIGAKVNGKIEKLDYKVQNGDLIEILVSKSDKEPTAEWIKFAKQSSTKAKIRHQLRQFEQEDLINKAKEELNTFIYKSIKLDLLLLDAKVLKEILLEFNCDDLNQLYLKYNGGTIQKNTLLGAIIRKLNLSFKGTILEKKSKKNTNSDDKIIKSGKVIFESIGELDYLPAKCCNPKLNDEIVGIVTLKDGLKIHKINCSHLDNFPTDRLIKAIWK